MRLHSYRITARLPRDHPSWRGLRLVPGGRGSRSRLMSVTGRIVVRWWFNAGKHVRVEPRSMWLYGSDSACGPLGCPLMVRTLRKGDVARHRPHWFLSARAVRTRAGAADAAHDICRTKAVSRETVGGLVGSRSFNVKRLSGGRRLFHVKQKPE